MEGGDKLENYVKNFGFRHRAGILMPISSLPSKYGIGGMGRRAREFVDFLDASGQTCWQVLPINPTSYGDSPYQSPSSAAGNPYFIDLETLYDNELLSKRELEAEIYNTDRVDYKHLFDTRYRVLRIAHSRFVPGHDYEEFITSNAAWLEDYALFMTLKEHYRHIPWTKWNEEHKDHEKAVLYITEFEAQMSFWRWLQYEFSNQWQSLLKYAHSKGVLLIGDMPIYVAHDSMDVWSSPEQFLLNENYEPEVVSGCPPDHFSSDGQLWGNPIYNWDIMAEQAFSWWTARVGRAFDLFDILRIDHFRGFASYYSIPYGSPNAKSGEWKSAPGAKLFEAIKNKYTNAKIIAEDLGTITDDVRELLDITGFPGMKMPHFAFDEEDSEYLTRMYDTRNCVVYASSHDSECTYSWIKNMTSEAQERFDNECPHIKGQSRTYDFIEYVFNSKANLAMVAMQDYLLLPNEEGRMNTPSTAFGNWTWRINPSYNTPKLRSDILELAVKTGRNK